MAQFSILTATIAFVAIALAALKFFLSPAHDSREPPSVAPGIPIVGHVIGFMRYSFSYYTQLRDKYRLPIFTVCMPGRKIYIVCRPDLISKVDKKTSTLSVAPIIAEFSSAACGTSRETTDIIFHNLYGEHGAPSLVEDMVVGLREALRPGQMVDDMNRVMASKVSHLMDAIKPDPDQKFRRIQFGTFVQHMVTMATTDSVYGPHNPYQRKEVRDAFFAFEKGIVKMLFYPFPSRTAKDAIKQRDQVAKALEDYFAKGQYEEGSALPKARWHYSVKNKVPIADIGRLEVAGTIAILLNSIPSVYWMLLSVHTVPGLLTDIRKEVDAALILDKTKNTVTIDITVIKNECPLLLSTLKESLRVRGMGTSVRVVREDTELEGYLLKKGAMVQVPMGVAHTDPQHWGPDFDSFKPRRFLKDSSGKKIPDDSAYRVFGGGKHLCPGRWFATNEILAVVALFISRYEMRPSDGADWVEPTAKNSSVIAQVATADFEIDVDVFAREGFSEYHWTVMVSPSKKVSSLLIADSVDT